jgi:acetolactate synthase-1/3 small subunit
MGAKIVDIGSSTVTFEYCETADKIQTLIDLLKPYGIREIVRTGTVAIDKGKAQVTT